MKSTGRSECGARYSSLVVVALLCLFWVRPTCAFAQEEKSKEVPPPFSIAGKVSHNVQKYSGLNFLAGFVASTVASAGASIYARGITKVKIRPYNATDLWQGEFREIEIRIKSGKVRGVPIGSVRLRTTTPFKLRYLPWGKSQSGLVTPVLVAIEGDVSKQLVGKALRSKSVSENLRFLKLDLPGLGEQRLQILQPEVNITEDKVSVKAHLVTAGAPKETGIDLMVNAKPTVEKERFIILKDMKIRSADIENPEQFAFFVEQLLNPLIDLGRLDRQTHAFRLTELNVKDNRVHFVGRLLLAPKPKRVGSQKNSMVNTIVL